MPDRLLRFALADKHPEPRIFRTPGSLSGCYDAVIIDGGLVIRVDHHEFLVEDGLDGGSVGRLSTELGFGTDGGYRVERQDASLLITGRRALEVFAQTCGVNVAEMGEAFFKTRIALTSCSVRRDDVGGVPGYRLWVEPSYGHYLWQALHEIVAELGGAPVGWECLERAV